MIVQCYEALDAVRKFTGFSYLPAYYTAIPAEGVVIFTVDTRRFWVERVKTMDALNYWRVEELLV